MVIYFFFSLVGGGGGGGISKPNLDKVVELVSEGSLINGLHHLVSVLM